MSVPDLGGSNPDKQWFSVLVLLLENRFWSLRILARLEIFQVQQFCELSHMELFANCSPVALTHHLIDLLFSFLFGHHYVTFDIHITYMLGKNKHLYTNLDVLSLPVLPPGPQCTRLHPSFQLSLSTVNLLKSSTSYSHGTKRLQFHYKMWAKGGGFPSKQPKPNVLLLAQSGRVVSAVVSSLHPEQTQWPDLLSLSSTSGKGGCCSNRESCEVRPSKIFQKPLAEKT